MYKYVILVTKTLEIYLTFLHGYNKHFSLPKNLVNFSHFKMNYILCLKLPLKLLLHFQILNKRIIYMVAFVAIVVFINLVKKSGA
jgi:hypothetical protein